MTSRLHPDDRDEIVQLVAIELMARLTGVAAVAPHGRGYVDTRAAARHLGVSENYVREHAERLGGTRIGSGPRARLRFDLDRLDEAIAAPAGGPEGKRPEQRKRRATTLASVDLLPVNHREPQRGKAS